MRNKSVLLLRWGLLGLALAMIAAGLLRQEHLEVLGRIVAIASTDEDTDKLVASADAEKLFANLNGLT